MIRHNVFLFALVLLAVVMQASAQDFIQNYLDGKVFGANPGPCPNTTHRCEGSADTSKLPIAVQQIPLTLFEGVCFGLTVFGECLGYSGGFTRPLGGPNGWLQGGEVDIFDLQCAQMGVTDLSLTVQGSPTSFVVGTRIKTLNLRQSCTGNTEFRDLIMEYSNAPVVGDIRFTLSGDANFQTGAIVGLDFDITINWFSDTTVPVTESFKDTIPVFVTIPESQCFIATEDRIGFEFISRNYDAVTLTIFGFSIPFASIFKGLDIDKVFIAALEASFGITVCRALQFSAVTEAGGQGPLNDELEILYDYFYDELTNGEPDDVEFLDRNLVAATQQGEYPFSFEDKQRGFPVTQEQLDLSVNFNDSAVFELVSVGINGFMNEDSPNRAGFAYPKAVNEVIERLLGTDVNGVVEPDPFGTFYFDLIEEGYFLNTELSFKWARMNISLERLDFKGLNTIKEFGILENNYCNDDDDDDCEESVRLNYTLNHSFQAGDVSVGIKTRIKLKNDEWVTASTQCPNPPFPTPYPTCELDATEYVFFVNLTFIDFTLIASTTHAFNPDLLDELQIGQLTGIDFGGDLSSGFSQISSCIMPGFYTFIVPNFNISVDEIVDPTASFEEGDQEQLANLIRNSVFAFNTLVGSAMEEELPQFAQSPNVRGEMNAFLFDEIDSAFLSNCDPYVVPPTDEIVDWEFGPVSYFYPVINRVLGGAFITTRDTDTDINDLVQIIMEYYSGLYDDFIFEPTDPVIQGVWLSKDEFQDFTAFPAYVDFGPPEDNFLNFGNIELYNVNQVEEFLLETFGETQNGIQFKLNISNTTNDIDGDPLTPGTEINLNPFQASIDFNVYALDNYDNYFTRDPVPINDKMKITLTLQDIDMWVAFNEIVVRVNQLNSLRLRQVRNSFPCVVSALESFEVAGSILFADKLFLNVSVSQIEEAGPAAGGSQFGVAMAALADSLTVANGFPSVEYKTMLNTILDNGLRQALVTLKEAGFEEYTPETCDTAEDPVGGYVSFLSGLRLPNATELIGECVATPNEPLPIGQVEAQVLNAYLNTTWLDWETSFVGRRLEASLGSNQGASTLNTFLIALANTSGTPLADAFYLEEYNGQTVVSMNLELNQENFVFSLFDFEPLIYADDDIIPGFRFEAQNLTVRGINKFLGNTELFNAVSKWITEYSLEFNELNPLDISINGYFEAHESFRGGTGNTKIREDWQLATKLTGFRASAQLLAAINLDIFANLSLGHFFDVTEGDLDITINAFADECLFSCIYDGGISLSALNVSIQELEGPTFTTQQNTYFSSELEAVVDETFKLITKFYLDAIPNIAQNCVRTQINDNFRQKWLDSQNGACPTDPINTELPESDQYFRFGTSRGIERFQDFMSENFYADDYSVWNDVIAATTVETGTSNPATLYKDNENEIGFQNYELRYNDVGYGFMNLSIFDVQISNADTFSAVSIVEPVTDFDNYTTLNGFIVGAIDKNNDQVIDGLRLVFNLEIATEGVFITYGDGILRNDLEIEILFQNLTAFLEMFALVNTTQALKIRFSSVSSINELPCLLAPVDALTPNAFNLSLDGLELSFKCVGECQFPLLEELAAGGTFTAGPESDLANLFNDAIQYVVDYVTSSSAQRLIDAQLETAEDTCAELLGLITSLLAFDTQEDFNVAQVMGIAFAGSFFVGSFASLLLFPLHKKRRLATLAKFKMTQKLMTEDKERMLLENEMKSLMAHPATPFPAKFLVPLFCILHIIGLIFAITGPAINIIIQFTFLGAKTQQIVLVPFSVVSTINDIWNSGAWPLALLIGLASCAWPIIKNALLFVIWFSPTTILKRAKRASYLTILDVIGKWSFLDVFIVVMTLAALRTYLRLSTYGRLSFLPSDAFEADVNVTPEYGIVLLCFIASTSLIVNHVETFYHGKAEKANQFAEDAIRGFSGKAPARATKRVAIMDHYFAGSDRRGRRKRVSQAKVRLVIFINLISGAMVLIGIILPVITFRMKGLIGLLLAEVDSNLAKRTYSIIDLGSLVSEAPANDAAGYFVNTFFQFLFFLNSAVFPMLQVIVNTLMLSMKLTLREAKSFFWLNMIVSFWAALECFIIAIIMTIIEIKQITVYIVNFISDDLCSNIQGLLEGILGSANGACLDVSGVLEPAGTFFLFVGVFVQLLVTLTVIMTVSVVIEDRYFQSYNGLRRVEKPSKPGFVKKFILRFMTKVTKPKKANNRRPNQAGPASNSINLNSVAVSRQGSANSSNTNNLLDQFYASPGSEGSIGVKNPMHESIDMEV